MFFSRWIDDKNVIREQIGVLFTYKEKWTTKFLGKRIDLEKTILSKDTRPESPWSIFSLICGS